MRLGNIADVPRVAFVRESGFEGASAVRALVTGGGGFIGSRLVQSLLKNGHQVRVLDINRDRLPGRRYGGVDFVGLSGDSVRGGIVDPSVVRQAVKGIDVVYHLAINWNGHSWRGKLPQSELFESNVTGTINLLEAAQSYRVKQFLFAGSIAVYGKRSSPVKDENEVCRPELWKGGPGPGYAILKLATEKLCLMYHYEYALPVTVLRIDVVFDDEEYQDLSPETIRKARRGDVIEVARGEGGACVHVDDVVRAFSLATLNWKAYGRIFNISSPGAYISDFDVCRIVIKSLRSKSKLKLVKGPGLTGPRIQSAASATRVLGWRPNRMRKDLEATIARMVDNQ